jgi:hypothetical protein
MSWSEPPHLDTRQYLRDGRRYLLIRAGLADAKILKMTAVKAALTRCVVSDAPGLIQN